MRKIPKTLHVYWGGDILPYMRYLTVSSFIKYNPDWDVVLWMPENVSKNITWRSGENDYKLKCKNFMPELLKLKVHKVYVNFDAVGFKSSFSEVHKADYIRINAMSIYGGVWSDMDIIYFKPIQSLGIDNDKDTFVCISDYGHSTGFLMSSDKSEFFNTLRDNLSKEFNPSHYQCIGPSMFNKYYPKISKIPSGFNIPMSAVYRYDANSVKELLENKKADFKDSIGCHWYGGNSMWEEFINNTNGGLIKVPDCILKTLL